jgi:hypothetical protein
VLLSLWHRARLPVTALTIVEEGAFVGWLWFLSSDALEHLDSIITCTNSQQPVIDIKGSLVMEVQGRDYNLPSSDHVMHWTGASQH